MHQFYLNCHAMKTQPLSSKMKSKTVKKNGCILSIPESNMLISAGISVLIHPNFRSMIISTKINKNQLYLSLQYLVATKAHPTKNKNRKALVTFRKGKKILNSYDPLITVIPHKTYPVKLLLRRSFCKNIYRQDRSWICLLKRPNKLERQSFFLSPYFLFFSLKI